MPDNDLENAIQNIYDYSFGVDDVNTLIMASVSDIENICGDKGLEPDYIIERAIERATDEVSDYKNLFDSISTKWLGLEALNWAVPYELKIRCAQFMGNYYNEFGIDEKKIKKLAESDNWTDRLVCGWTIRDNNASFAKEIKDQLANDMWQDDNGFLLVSESIGINTNREEMLEAMRNDVGAIEYASDSLKADREFVLEAIKIDPWLIEYASDTLKADREVMLEAVRNDGLVLEFASEELQNDPELIKLAEG
jgi:hypothetical protein